jgi:hypothetical protein
MLLHFLDHAERYGLSSVNERKESAIKKLGSMCLRYSLQMVRGGFYESARKYLNISLIFDRDVQHNGLYKCLRHNLEIGNEDICAIEKEVAEQGYETQRTQSFLPPEGFVEIYNEDDAV